MTTAPKSTKESGDYGLNVACTNARRMREKREMSCDFNQAKVMQTEGDGHELMELAALDRRVAEVRARIVWFDTAAAGNALPRAEFW